MEYNTKFLHRACFATILKSLLRIVRQVKALSRQISKRTVPQKQLWKINMIQLMTTNTRVKVLRFLFSEGQSLRMIPTHLERLLNILIRTKRKLKWSKSLKTVARAAASASNKTYCCTFLIKKTVSKKMSRTF